MPRASRYLLSGYTYHLTQRCHDREFLLRFARDRDAYREWLRVGTRRYGVPVYGYCITSNHVHVVVHVEDVEAIGALMQLAAGAGGQQYNRRKGTSGAFWEDSYQCTIIENERHLWNCLQYVDLNMVRAGVVRHPREWRWSGYGEVMGTRQRYRIVDLERLAESLDAGDLSELRESYESGLAERLAKGMAGREPQWTEALAVGSKPFVTEVQSEYRRRSRFVVEECGGGGETGTWCVREGGAAYRSF